MAATGKYRNGSTAASSRILRWLLTREAGLVILLLVVVALFWLLEPSTRQQRVYWDLLREISPNLISAIGITMLLLAVTSITTVVAFNATGSMWLGIIIGLATGPIVGGIHGYLVTRQGMSSLVTTLGSLFALRGMVYVYTNKTPVIDENGFYDFQDAYYNNLGPVPLPFALAVILVALALGGIALNGGKGSLVGTVLGILILGMTAKGLRLMGVNTNVQLMVTGSIMILAVFMHSFHDRISILRKS